MFGFEQNNDLFILYDAEPAGNHNFRSIWLDAIHVMCKILCLGVPGSVWECDTSPSSDITPAVGRVRVDIKPNGTRNTHVVEFSISCLSMMHDRTQMWLRWTLALICQRQDTLARSGVNNVQLKRTASIIDKGFEQNYYFIAFSSATRKKRQKYTDLSRVN